VVNLGVVSKRCKNRAPPYESPVPGLLPILPCSELLSDLWKNAPQADLAWERFQSITADTRSAEKRSSRADPKMYGVFLPTI